MAVNIPSQLVVQDAATWAADSTVYTDKRILITSDVFYSGTDQPRFKFANGVDTWANLDYVPEGGGSNTVVFSFYAINNTSLVDSTTYKFSSTLNPSTTVLYTQVPLPSGTLKAVYCQVANNSVVPSSEDCTLKLISNDEADSYTISTTFKLDANRYGSQNFTGLNESITAGGAYIELDIPVMATNANFTTLRFYVEMEL